MPWYYHTCLDDGRSINIDAHPCAAWNEDGKGASNWDWRAGTFPLCFTGYRDPSKVVNGYWNELNLKGLVDYRRKTKRAYSTVQEVYVDTASLREEQASCPQ